MKIKVLLTIVIGSFFLFFINVQPPTTVLAADVCSDGTACSAYVMWDRPDACESRYVETYDDNGVVISSYWYYWQAYESVPMACLPGTNCGWSSTGTICNGGNWQTYDPWVTPNVPFSGGCCGGSIGGGGDPCTTVVGDGCYDNNCPEWGVGHGKGTNGCSSYQYYCTGTYTVGDCNTNPPPPPPPSCTVSLAPSTSTVSTGLQAQYVATVYPSNGTVSSVTFSSSSPSTAYVNPSIDTTVAYSTHTTGASVGTATITASVTMGGSVRCFDTSQINVLPNDPWWQVGDSDVLTNGSIGSSVPTSLYFNLAGGGGFPGVAIYGGTTNLTSAKVSTKHWLANTSNTTNRVYGSSYFINSIPGSVTQNDISSSVFDQSVMNAGTSSSDGYVWFRYDGTTALNISTLNLGSKKVILIADLANININGNINLTKGSGFFLLVTKGRVSVNSSVGGGGFNLEGIYISDGAFSSGTKKTSTVNDTKLSVRGTVAAYGGMNLQRDLGVGNASSPGEYFEYAPDLELLFPASLSSRVTNWREVAP
jgi:hypothetical protein